MIKQYLDVICISTCVIFTYTSAKDTRKGKDEVQAVCNKNNSSICCANYKLVHGTCVVCPKGTFGVNCTGQCPAGYYGHLCFEKCECSPFLCHSQNGCTYTVLRGKMGLKWRILALTLAGVLVTFIFVGLLMCIMPRFKKTKSCVDSYECLPCTNTNEENQHEMVADNIPIYRNNDNSRQLLPEQSHPDVVPERSNINAMFLNTEVHNWQETDIANYTDLLPSADSTTSNNTYMGLRRDRAKALQKAKIHIRDKNEIKTELKTEEKLFTTD